ncbi:MAG: hypothetical protein HC895_06720 [Leptolyngbyaceae cyanobacterium SM1_3_5]|nr:hypothetical protein [Leptolyngbyaceae cyanobacterium SM1_3_5]
MQDLNTEIDPGWTDSGQTNYLLGRIAMRSYIFNHVLSGGEPLIGQALIDNVVATARSLPGFAQWCQHQHELGDRAAEWARCIENSPYYHYGLPQQPRAGDAAEGIVVQPNPRELKRDTWNRKQSKNAQTRIQNAIADLTAKNVLPDTITARFQALTQYGISGSSLYRYRQLWHPHHQEQPTDNLSNLVGLKSPAEATEAARNAS